MPAPDVHSTSYDVAIVGAGPVGLLLGCLLGARGLRVILLDRRTELPKQSQAIGITPPSLQILALLNLDQEFIRHGVPIRDCHVHGQGGYLGCASFRKIPGEYPFILSLPQQISMRLLEQKLAEYPSVTLQRGLELQRLQQDQTHVTLEMSDSTGRPLILSAAFTVGCDGHSSRVREMLNLKTKTQHYGCHFQMGDFTDQSQLGQEAHLFFTAEGAVESFPLPQGLRRWIVQTEKPATQPVKGLISRLVHERCGITLTADTQLNETIFSPWRLDCGKIYQDRTLLCGDAAHVMSPIGGQGMNTGFADAEFAAALLHAVIQRNQPAEPWLKVYDRCRRVAGSTAANRAAMGMWLGTWQGARLSQLRDLILRVGIFRSPLNQHLGPWFAMLTLPYNRLHKSTWAATRLDETAP